MHLQATHAIIGLPIFTIHQKYKLKGTMFCIEANIFGWIFARFIHRGNPYEFSEDS